LLVLKISPQKSTQDLLSGSYQQMGWFGN